MDHQNSRFNNSCQFPITSWTLISEAQNDQRDGHLAALGQLTSTYWKPVFYFIRAKGYPLHRAEDLIQEFFLQFLQRAWLRRADPQRGRFRTFLLKILTRFLIEQMPPRNRLQDRFENEIFNISGLLSDEERSFNPPINESPEEIFMKRWSIMQVDQVKESVRMECIADGREDWYQLFVLSAMPDAGEKNSQPALARKFGLSRDQVRYRLEQVRRRFDRSFRIELRCDGCSEKNIEEEVGELLKML